jgi:hypothetical protein
MFRKILLSGLASVGLLSTAALPLEAHPVRPHHYEYHHGHYRPYAHRAFCNWAEANAWMCHQRQCGIECYFEWHGPQCFVFYR